MNEEKFWNIIDSVQEEDTINKSIYERLSLMTKIEILEFDKIFKKNLNKAYTFPLLSANFVITSYVSDDCFEQFRAWLIMRGKEKFNAALINPETIAIWLSEIEANLIEEKGEEILSIPLKSYILAGGNETLFYEKEYIAIEPDIDICWPKTKEDYKLQYPKLVEKFWNQELINKLH